jgi:hypothetical protein
MRKNNKTSTLEFQKAIAFLESDIPKNLVTLKYLNTYHTKDTKVVLVEDENGWAVLFSFPTSILSFDREAYPRAKVALFINGTSENGTLNLLDSLPENNYILRLNRPLDLSGLENKYKVSRGNTYLSYSCNTLINVQGIKVVPANSVLTKDAVKLISQNGHDEADLKEYFKNGARWFGVIKDNILKSVCFIYQDYGNFMEIGGVRTLKSERRKGYARIVVYSAIKYLLVQNFLPRYCTEEKNINSIRLAESLGMKQFLKIEHYLLDPL